MSYARVKRTGGVWGYEGLGFLLDGGRGGSRERYLIVVVGLEASRTVFQSLMQ